MLRSVTRLITRNFGWKFISLLSAFILWYLLSGARELTTSISVPVQYRDVPKDLEISSDIAEQVHLVLRGPSPLLSRLNASSLPVIIDLSEVRSPGLRTITLDRNNVNLSASVTLERTVPSQIQLRLETRLPREVLVQPRYEHIPDGMHVIWQRVTPERLTIIGPLSRVQPIDHVDTDPVDLRQLNAYGEISANAYAGHPQVNFSGPSKVKIQVRLGPLRTPAPPNP